MVGRPFAHFMGLNDPKQVIGDSMIGRAHCAGAAGVFCGPSSIVLDSIEHRDYCTPVAKGRQRVRIDCA